MPKSSMATAWPRALAFSMVARAASTFMKPRSVASSQICCASMPVPASARSSTSSTRPVSMSLAHRLMAMCSSRSASSAVRMSAITQAMTWSVMGRISSASSATGMNRSGRIMLPSGRRQRISASAPTHTPVSSAMIG
ncbi:hypothetical protein D3C81_1047950 [compost metagenome]